MFVQFGGIGRSVETLDDRFLRGRTRERPHPPAARPAEPAKPEPMDLRRMRQVVTEFVRLAGNAPTRPSTQAAAMRRRLVERSWESMASAPTAIHEAGHIVCLIDSGIRPWDADIVADSECLGRCSFNLIRARLQPEAIATASFAGAAAEQMFRREILGQASDVCSTSDADWSFVDSLSPVVRQRAERTASQRVSWLAVPIRAVARELLANERLSGLQIVNVCRPYAYCFENRSVFRQ